MKRFKKAICLLLIFSLTLSLFVIPASASPIAIVGTIVAIAGAFVTLDDLLDKSVEHTDRFLSLFDGGLITDIEVGEGETVAGYVFKAYNTNRNWITGNSVQVSFESLSQLTLTLNSYGISCTLKTQSIIFNNSRMTVWVVIPHDQLIVDTAYGVAGFYQGPVLLANQSGYPYYAAASTDNTTSTNTNYNYYTQEGGDSSTTNNEYNYTTGDTVNNPIFKYGDEVTENNQVYDYSSDSYVEVGDITYDASTKQYITNITIDNSVHVQYNIDHTSITYIGSSAEDKTYNLYYELPDGRNSSELTAEDLEQLVLNYNVINYGVSADDGRLRALYHFDGDLEDSSYWSKYSSWDWISGASITYLESNAFGGALYLDEKAHEFTITLPSNFASSDFSILFRYYVSPTTSTTSVQDFVLKSGNVNLWTVNVSASNPVPAGQWFEFAFIRDGSILYCYINGIAISSTSFSSTLGNSLTFSFAQGSVYRQLDELRVYNFATSEAGADYTPTAVPVDTNAVLILPDQATPVPDGYWDFDTDGNVWPWYDLTNGITYNWALGVNSYSSGFSSHDTTVVQRIAIDNFSNFFDGKIRYDTTASGDYTVYSDYYSFAAYRDIDPAAFQKDIAFPASDQPSDYYGINTPFGWFPNSPPSSPTLVYSNGNLPVWNIGLIGYNGNYINPYNLNVGEPVSFTVVDLAGQQYSATIELPDSFVTPSKAVSPYSSQYVLEEYDWGVMGLALLPFNWNSSGTIDTYDYSSYLSLVAFISPSDADGIDMVYMEIKNGQPNDNSDAYVTEIYNDIDLTMPTVAIRSQIPIREYRIGGVRPTVPYRGDVWMMVENSHITSVQIYTGFAWQEVDLRIWTGQRWVSALYYNIMTQQDYTDILGTTDNEYIQSQEGFYSWLTKQFKELLAILNEISDQIEEIDSGSGASLDFTFEIDGSTTVEFTKLSDDARNGLLTVMKPMYEVVFAELGTIYDGVLDDFVLLFSDTEDTITVDGETGYTFWYIFKADQEVWNVRIIS